MKKIREFIHRINDNSVVVGTYMKRYSSLYVFLLTVIAVFEVAMMVRGALIFDFTRTKHILYYVSYIILFTASLVTAVIVGVSKKRNLSLKTLSAALNIYACMIVVWATLISALDMEGSHYPIVYLTIIVTLGGVVVMNPLVFTLITLLSTVALIVSAHYVAPSGGFTSGDFFNLFVFLVMSFVVAFRNYTISIHEEKNREYLNQLSHTDMMTGLASETSYFEKVDEIQKSPEKEFTVLLMDLNGLKFTNDRYGHRFGSYLIKTAAKQIKTIFHDDCCYHVGGDEFIVIMENSASLNEKMTDYRQRLEYQILRFEDRDLYLSVAVGYAVREKGETYQQTFQRADNAMYENKKIIKAKYHIAGSK